MNAYPIPLVAWTGGDRPPRGHRSPLFVAMRRARDATLAMPVLILPSVQVNMRAGQLPAPEDNGVAYLKIPLNAL